MAQKRQANYIAPLQPPTLAPVKAWGSSEGAGRIGLAHTYFNQKDLVILKSGAKVLLFFDICKFFAKKITFNC